MAGGTSVLPDAEFRLGDGAFARIRELMRQRAGIDLAEGKRSLVYGRLARRLRELGLRDFDAYLGLVEDPNVDEAQTFLNALTTNVTSFFREPHHFDYLDKQLVPELKVRLARGERARIWSAGCSTGEEPYTIAMALLQAGLSPAAGDVKILATDIDSQVLGTARRGVYPNSRVEQIAPERLKRFFRAGRGANAGMVRVTDEVREFVTFRSLNLVQSWPIRGRFDAIFCRNVIIYFDAATRTALVRRFVDALNPNGRLFLGHSEALVAGASRALKPSGRTIYSKSGSEH